MDGGSIASQNGRAMGSSAAKPHAAPQLVVLKQREDLHAAQFPECALWQGDVAVLLESLPQELKFDLVITSPPYNIGKPYETKQALADYLAWQKKIIDAIVPRLKENGSVCWQVGNFVNNGQIWPLDIELAPLFKNHGLQLRNRIVWHFGHGRHGKKRFSGRYEVVLWFTKGEEYAFHLDRVRIPAKYPGKRHFKGPNAGKLSGNKRGKNPEDVWNIPNVVANHVEKTTHPCQFPVGLVERLILALSEEKDLVFDPFAGVASAGVAAAIHNRRFLGAELKSSYVEKGASRLRAALKGRAKYRPHDKPVFDHTKSSLSKRPKR